MLIRPVQLYGDNVNANNLANNAATSSQTRHIALHERFVSEKALEGLIRVIKVDSASQIADMFTKPLPKDALRRHAASVSLVLLYFALTCVLCSEGFYSNNLLHKHLRDIYPTPLSTTSNHLGLESSSRRSLWNILRHS